MQRLERMIARKLISTIQAEGHVVSIFDGEDESERFAKLAPALNELGACDVEYLFVWSDAEAPKRLGWVELVYGNDGWDLISDYGTSLETLLTPVNAFARRLEMADG